MKHIAWTMSGLQDQAEAERRLEDMLDWARRSFELGRFTVDSGVRHGAFGWKAEIFLKETIEENAVG